MVSGMLDPGGDRSFIFCKNVQETKQEGKSEVESIFMLRTNQL